MKCNSFTQLLRSGLLALLLALPVIGAGGEEIPADRDEPSGYLVADERSPLDAFRPDRAGWLAWAGPILMGTVAYLLIVFIRVFSRNAHPDNLETDADDEDDAGADRD